MLPPLAVAGVLAPLLGGALVQGAGEIVVAGPAQPPASVTLPIPPEPPAALVAPAAGEPVIDVVPAARLLTSDVPWQLWQAYSRAAAGTPSSCHLEISLLEAIGQVESGSLAGRALDAGHRAVPAVLGPVLDGRRFAAIRDTDDGRLDGNTTWDRAVGPMQFIPSTWARWGVDADGDGRADPQDIDDAAAGTSAYLCAGGRDLSTAAGLRAAVLSYNHSTAYLAVVLRWKARFDATAPGAGVVALPMALPAAPAKPRHPKPKPAPHPVVLAEPAPVVTKPEPPAPEPPASQPPVVQEPPSAEQPAEEPPAPEPPVSQPPVSQPPAPEPPAEQPPATCAAPADETEVPAEEPAPGTEPAASASPSTPAAPAPAEDPAPVPGTGPNACETDGDEGGEPAGDVPDEPPAPVAGDPAVPAEPGPAPTP